MLNGDISNMSGITVAFRCEDFLIKYKESSFLDKLLNVVSGKAKRADIDEHVLSVMEYLYRNTEYTVDLIVEEVSYTNDLIGVLDSIPFNRVVLIKKLSQVSTRLRTGDLSFYVDDNSYRRSLVNSPFAVSLDEFSNVVRWGGVRWNRRSSM